jgi:hypothetical protein
METLLYEARYKDEDKNMNRRAEDFERELWIASQKYVYGDIALEDLEAMEQVQSEKIGKAVLILSKQSIRKSFLNRFYKLFHVNREQLIALI